METQHTDPWIIFRWHKSCQSSHLTWAWAFCIKEQASPVKKIHVVSQQRCLVWGSRPACSSTRKKVTDSSMTAHTQKSERMQLQWKEHVQNHRGSCYFFPWTIMGEVCSLHIPVLQSMAYHRLDQLFFKAPGRRLIQPPRGCHSYMVGCIWHGMSHIMQASVCAVLSYTDLYASWVGPTVWASWLLSFIPFPHEHLQRT